jgi:hypothetical protein
LSLITEIKNELAKKALEETGVKIEESAELLESICQSVNCNEISKDRLYELLLIGINARKQAPDKNDDKERNGSFSDFIFL